MTQSYVQKAEVELRKGARRDQILGIVFQLMGLGLIPVAVVVTYWMFFGVGAALGFGIWLTQRFYSSPREFEYAFTGSKLIVSRTNLLGRGRRMLEIALGDVTSFTGFYDMVMQGDLIAAANVNSDEVKALTFMVDEREYRLLFSPDVYLTTLLSEKLKKDKKDSAEKK